jgi:iron(III) transport system substrate-binding protein
MSMLRAGIAVQMAFSAIVVFALRPTFALAQATNSDNSAIYSYNGADRGERLVAKAREEGTLTLYTSMATTESAPLAQAFEKKFGIKVQLWRALSENVLQRALTEARGHRGDQRPGSRGARARASGRAIPQSPSR